MQPEGLAGEGIGYARVEMGPDRATLSTKNHDDITVQKNMPGDRKRFASHGEKKAKSFLGRAWSALQLDPSLG